MPERCGPPAAALAKELKRDDAVERVRPAAGEAGQADTDLAQPAPEVELPRLSSRALFRAAREIIIEHDGADYRLRLTANGKLILTK